MTLSAVPSFVLRRIRLKTLKGLNEISNQTIAMRRIELVKAYKTVALAITASNYKIVVRKSLSKEKEKEGTRLEIIEAFQKYFQLSLGFGKNEMKIVNIFGLRDLQSAKFIETLMNENITPPNHNFVNKISRSISYFLEFTPQILELLEQEGTKWVSPSNLEEVPSNSTDKTIITVILPENQNQSSSPERLIKVLESINGFYRVVCTVEKIEDSTISITAVDSGSDKSFDFAGIAQGITALKELILGLYDRVVFYKERKASERLDLIIKALPIIETIHKMQESGVMEAEQAELSKRSIHSYTKLFLECGAVLPEFTNHVNVDPRQIMAPEPKLLTTRSSSPEKAAESVSPKNANQSPPPKTVRKKRG